MSYEYQKLLKAAVRLVEVKELPAEVNEKIALLEKQIDNLQEEIDLLVERDAVRWERYAASAGIALGDIYALNQWTYRYGNGRRIERLATNIGTAQTQIDVLRLAEFKDEHQEEIFRAFEQFGNPGVRLRWPRLRDSLYPGVTFSPGYLLQLATGNTAQFADRHFIFPAGISLEAIISTNLGSFDQTLTKSSQSSESISTDWNASASASYGWFKMNASASEQVHVKEDLKTTQSIRVSCRSLLSIGFDNSAWFNSNVFNNLYIRRNPRIFAPFFGPRGTLRYYPVRVLIMRGMRLEFNSSANYNYDYERTFSVSGSASARVFGISFGGGGGYNSHQQKQEIKSQGNKLIMDDGEKNFRVIGFVLNKVTVLDATLFGPLSSSIESSNPHLGLESLGNIP